MGNPLTAVPMRAARWSAEHPWRAILAWVAFVAVAVGLAVAIPTHETTDADYRVGESGRADAMIADAGLDPTDTENVLVAGAGATRPPRRRSPTRPRTADGVLDVSGPQPSGDGSAHLVSVEVEDDEADGVTR